MRLRELDVDADVAGRRNGAGEQRAGMRNADRGTLEASGLAARSRRECVRLRRAPRRSLERDAQQRAARKILRPPARAHLCRPKAVRVGRDRFDVTRLEVATVRDEHAQERALCAAVAKSPRRHVSPPSIQITCRVRYAAASENKYATSPATSSGLPMRRAGTSLRISSSATP